MLPHSTEEGLYLASHLWRVGEERLVLLEEKEGQDLMFKPLPLTPEMRTAAYPMWLKEKQWVCAYRATDSNYDLYRGELGKTEFTPILETSDFSEFSSTYDAETNTLYFERLDTKGNWSIAALNLETMVLVSYDLGVQAKEPHFTQLSDSWFQ